MKGCFIDLLGALISGSKSSQSKVGIALAQKIYPAGDIPVIGSDKTFGFLGASAVYGDFGINQVRDENISIRTLVDRVNDLVK